MPRWLIAGILAFSAVAVRAAEPVEIRSPVSPEESLKLFQLDDGLTIELVACEPEVVDPVTIAFGEDGSLWVVEMRDYPKGPQNGEPPFSKIKRLFDHDGDGRFETATIFAENLLFPTGLLPWNDGVIVTLAGEIAFFADRDSDGKAEFKETWFTGFAQENSQLRHNHPTLGLDGYIYVANGLRGGTIVPAKGDWKAKNEPVALTGYDFRFDPQTGACEAIAGNGQFGLTFDDWGNRFVCSNRNPCQHVVLENWHLKLNPHVAVKAVMHDVAAAGENSRIYPISKFWTTSQLHAGQFTAACGVMIYRGDGLGEAYYGNAFTCDPTGSLVHREVLSPNGATFTGKSPYDQREFLATPDSWCRPVNLSHGPDGALYVVDMYRAVIEHPDWVPVELKNRPDERYGDDRGRIYRIRSKERAANSQAKWRLDQATITELSQLLSHPNAWQRDTAFRLLTQRWCDFAFRSMVDVIQGNATPQGKVAAMGLCQRFAPGKDYGKQLTREETDAHVRAAEWKCRDNQVSSIVRADVDPQARFQQALAIAASSLPVAGNSMLYGDLITAGVDNPWIRTAVLLSVRKDGESVLRKTLHIAEERMIPGLPEFVEELTTLMAIQDRADVGLDALLAKLPVGRVLLTNAIQGFAIGLQRRGKSWTEFVAAQPPIVRSRMDELNRIWEHDLLEEFVVKDRPVSGRLALIRLLKYAVTPNVVPHLLRIALNDPEASVRVAALDCLLGYHSEAMGEELLAAFPTQTPAVRRAILDVLLVNESRAGLLLQALEQQTISLSEIDATRSARLTNHRNADIKARADKLFAAAAADRASLLETYASSARMDADARNGRLVFEKNCATCHRVSNVGINVGPDVGDNYARTPQQLLLSILDPNRAVDNNYFGYTVSTIDGRVLTGIITAETASSITLKQPEGKVEIVLRDDIDELRGTGQSLMPIGLEKNISVDQMADLITFLKNWRYIDGNVPLK